MKLFKQVVTAVTLFCFSFALQAQSLPAGSIGSVVNPATGVTSTYTFSFTASVTGSEYIGFAFRQDPAYWYFTNATLTAPNSTTNLIVNGGFTAGGNITNPITHGQLSAPQNWGVWYQGNIYPPAAGRWTSGYWVDGAVGTYDGIYQGVSLVAGTLYTISFSARSTSQAGSNDQAMIGVYAGPCDDTTVAAASCAVSSANTGFTTVSTPVQAAGAGGPTRTGWATAPAAYGAWGASYYDLSNPSSTYSLIAQARAATARVLTVTQTITPYSVYATYQNRTVTPMVYPTYSDNTTGTTAQTDPNHSAYTETRQIADTVIQGTANSVDYTARIDQFAKLERANVNANSMLDSNVLDRHVAKDGIFVGGDDDITSYVNIDGNRSNRADSYRLTGSRFGLGFDYRYSPELILGAQYNHNQLNLAGTNSGGSLIKDHFGVYSAVNVEEFLIKSDLAVSFNKFGSAYSIPELGYSNTATTKGTDYWFNTRVYTPDVYGFRPFAALRWDHNKINATTATGSTFTAVTFDSTKSSGWSEEVGLSFEQEVIDDINVRAEVSRTTMNYRYGTLGVNYKVTKDSSIDLKIGQQRWDDVRNNTVQAHVKVLF